ncbi:nucleoside hydrolase [Laetiporus sulphureus 93-53]|uniref:Nucleoside hydrolase n=1 Tax=Laetiporus sulphureus 93-53 TaxID=1314785 RepID=A0A165GYN8_9APHY|nr:nucleoside hydrolase [Laetiporus sulphureus 93-53]KZT11005.1 nucleoside hydrolase [Laetiporus sulphureus 93-53]
MRIPVIIDTDPGVDDTLAILLALASPELEVLAIIISFGNTDIESSYLNILKLYKAIAKHLEQHPEDHARFPGYSSSTKIILAKGADHPLKGDLHSAQYFHGRDGLTDITHRHPDLDIKDIPQTHSYLHFANKTGVEVAAELIASRPTRSVTYLVLGPMTNLAQLMRRHGDVIRSRIGRIVCMGGALDVPGNTSPVAEFNFFADPYAVRELLTPTSPEMGLPLERFLLLPLDLTTPHELPFPYYRDKVDAAFESTKKPSRSQDKPPLVHFTSAFLERTREIMIEFGKDAMELHDIVALWCAIENLPSPDDAVGAIPTLQPGWRATKRKFEVERVGELTRGMLVVDRRDDPGAYAPGVNRAEVQAELDRHHFHHTGDYESTAVPAQVEVERSDQTEPLPDNPAGIACVVETPGSRALVKLMMERIWGTQGYAFDDMS